MTVLHEEIMVSIRPTCYYNDIYICQFRSTNRQVRSCQIAAMVVDRPEGFPQTIGVEHRLRQLSTARPQYMRVPVE